jgi:hypothetical protein
LSGVYWPFSASQWIHFVSLNCTNEPVNGVI